MQHQIITDMQADNFKAEALTLFSKYGLGVKEAFSVFQDRETKIEDFDLDQVIQRKKRMKLIEMSGKVKLDVDTDITRDRK